MTDEAEAALIAAADVAPILVRAGMLVQPVVDQLPAARGRMTDITLLRRLSAANLVYLLNKHAATSSDTTHVLTTGWRPAQPTGCRPSFTSCSCSKQEPRAATSTRGGWVSGWHPSGAARTTDTASSGCRARNTATAMPS
jgi:hypothetical protein